MPRPYDGIAYRPSATAAYGRGYRQAEARRRAVRTREAPGPNLLAHCGGWHVIAGLPFVCASCQSVILEEEPTHADA